MIFKLKKFSLMSFYVSSVLFSFFFIFSSSTFALEDTILTNDIAKTELNQQIKETKRKIISEFNDGVTKANKDLRAATQKNKAKKTAELRALVKSRKQTVLSIMKENPEIILQNKLSDDLKLQLPGDIQTNIEQNVSLEGTAEIFHIDGPILASGGFDPDKTKYEYYLKQGKTRKQIFFAGQPNVKDFLTDSKIKVSGVQLEDNLAVDAETAKGLEVLMAPANPYTFGPQKTLVLLVNFQNDPNNKPKTVSEAQTMFSDVNAFFKENSYEQTSIAADVFGWYTMPIANSDCDIASIAKNAESAATVAGVNVSQYSRRVYIYPRISACNFSGAAFIGGNPSKSWINGIFSTSVTNPKIAPNVTNHELGHNFGLSHSHAYSCPLGKILDVACTTIEYGDTFDTMGNLVGHFNPFQKSLLGWLDYNVSPPITTVTASGVYTIDTYETVGSSPKALRIPRGNGESFYVEIRRKIFQDTDINILNRVTKKAVANGDTTPYVFIHYAKEMNNNSSFILDIEPNTHSKYDSYIDLGQTFTDPLTGISIKVDSISSANATVFINLDNQICVHYNPSISLNPAYQAGISGSILTYSAKITNNDNFACTPFSFLITQSNLPNGWTFSAPLPITLSPGATVDFITTVQSPIDAKDGFYIFDEKVANMTATGYSGYASAIYKVQNDLIPPTVSITSPIDDSTVSGTISISASAFDDVGVNKVDFSLDNIVFMTDFFSPYSASFDTTALDNGNHLLNAIAYDRGDNKTVSANIFITVNNPDVIPTLSFSASPTSVPYGGSSILTWSSTRAKSCVASGGWSGAKFVSGSQGTGSIGPLTSDTTYTLTCTGPGGSVTQSVSVTVSTTGTFTDNFNRPNSTTLGNNWIEASGNFSINSNKINNAAIAEKQIAVQPSLNGANQDVSMSFSFNGLQAAKYGFVLRYKDEKNYYRLYRSSGASSLLIIAKVVNGIETILASKSLPNPVKNTLVPLTASVNGSTLTLSASGVKITATDSTFTSGSVGFTIESSGTQSADDFSVNVINPSITLQSQTGQTKEIENLASIINILQKIISGLNKTRN